MNDRQRLEAIIKVIGQYLPPDGIPINDAMSEIIGLVDPLPPQRKPLTDEQLIDLWPSLIMHQHTYAFARAIEAAHGIKE
jgi:hypothetical protein